MKIFTLLLFICIFHVKAEQQSELAPRLAIGFYYPSLNGTLSRTDIQVALSYWIKEITNKINMDNTYSVLFDDIKKMNRAFLDEKLDLIVAPPLLLAIYFDRYFLSDGFISTNKNSEQLIIIARKEQENVTDVFFKKRLILPTNNLLAKIFLETEVIKQYHRPYQQVFSNVSQVKKIDRIILDLFFSKADVAVVYRSAFDLMIELNPQIKNQITILKKMPVLSRNHAYFHRNYQYQAELKKQAHLISSTLRGQQILQLFYTSNIKKCFVSDLEKFDRLYQSYQNLLKTI